MESNKEYISTNIQFHSRDQRPTMDFGKALKKAQKNGSKEVRCYGLPVFRLNTKTGAVELGFAFGGEVADKIRSGELEIQDGMDWEYDEDTKKALAQIKKKKLKNSTRTWHNKI